MDGQWRMKGWAVGDGGMDSGGWRDGWAVGHGGMGDGDGGMGGGGWKNGWWGRARTPEACNQLESASGSTRTHAGLVPPLSPHPSCCRRPKETVVFMQAEFWGAGPAAAHTIGATDP